MALLLSLFAFPLFAQYTPAGYDRYLLPISLPAAAPGAFGSSWQSELSVYNDSTSGVTVYPYTACPPSVQDCNVPVTTLASGSFFTGTPRLDAGAPPATFLYVQHPENGSVDINLRVFDVSRSAATAGVELPPVPEWDFRQRMMLINIPIAPAFRHMLRLYHSYLGPVMVRMRVYAQDASGALLRDTTMNIPPATSKAVNKVEVPLDPGYASTTELTTDIQHSRVRVLLESQTIEESPLLTPPVNVPFWAFVSITNNETQQVTTVTPHDTFQ